MRVTSSSYLQIYKTTRRTKQLFKKRKVRPEL